MKLTKYAEIGRRQRRFTNFSLDIIQHYGRCESVPGGALKIFFGQREYQRAVEELKKTIQLMDRAKGGSVIMKDGNVITTYK